jgi:DNA damage-binding protein 1
MTMVALHLSIGSLVPNQPSSAFHSNLLLATSSGRLSSIIDLDSDLSRLLFDLQRNMARVVEGPGGITFSRWRDFKTDNGASPSVGFIDGDLVEKFLEIPEESSLMKEILEGSNKYEKLSVSYGEMCTVLEGLRRMH